ncbi:MAG: hypothetical protein O2958_03320 [Gemmatimonadetes bacterium]|nr:hypothetical protein [Gemmatimonadota bacterium]MDA1102350.1 hypothetical protein [Gemmatimonadota bacterium]
MKTLARLVLSRLLMTFALAAPTQLIAQEAPLTVGEQVKVRWHDRSWSQTGQPGMRSVIAEVEAYDANWIRVRRGKRIIDVPTTAITNIQRRVGTRPASAPAMVIGSGLGFAGGFLGGLMVAQLDRTATGSDVVNTGLKGGILVGAPMGALFAYFNSRSRGIYEDIGLGRVVPGVIIGADTRVDVSFRIVGG